MYIPRWRRKILPRKRLSLIGIDHGEGVIHRFSHQHINHDGVKFLQSGVKGSNAVIHFGIILGVIVYTLFIIALVVWKKGKLPLFHSLITIIEVAFFIALLSFIYGKYAFPLR